MNCVREFLVLFLVFVIWKITFNENISFTDYASGIRLPDCSKLTLISKHRNDVTTFWHDVIVKFFWRSFVSLVKFSHWFKFYVNIITGSGVMTISFYKGLTRNPEIPPSGFCPISGDWDKLEIPSLARSSPIKCFWMLQSSRVTASIVSELLRSSQQGGNYSPTPTED